MTNNLNSEKSIVNFLADEDNLDLTDSLKSEALRCDASGSIKVTDTKLEGYNGMDETNFMPDFKKEREGEVIIVLTSDGTGSATFNSDADSVLILPGDMNAQGKLDLILAFSNTKRFRNFSNWCCYSPIRLESAGYASYRTPEGKTERIKLKFPHSHNKKTQTLNVNF